MRLVCSKCGLAFESVIIDRSIAFQELISKSQNHIKFKHPEEFKLLALGVQRALAALAVTIHFDECIMIPEEEVWVRDQIEENREMIMEAIGYKPEEDEEDGEEEEESDNEPIETDPAEPISEVEPEIKS